MTAKKGLSLTVWPFMLPLGVLLGTMARLLQTAGGNSDSIEAALGLQLFASLALAIGLWTGPEALEDLAVAPGSALAPYAGAFRAVLRPILAVGVAVYWCRFHLAFSASGSWSVVWAYVAALPLTLSFIFIVCSAKGLFAAWRGLGAVRLSLDTAAAFPGTTLTAALRTSRKPKGVTALLIRHGSEAPPEDDDEAEARIPCAVSAPVPEGDGWMTRLSVTIPADAPPTLEDESADEKAPWRTYILEVEIPTAGGTKAYASEEVVVKAA